MAGMFELFVDTDAQFRFRLTAPDGTVMAISKAFEDKSSAVAGIKAVREYAGMGLITDLCPATTRQNPAAVAPQPHSMPPTRQEQCVAAADPDPRSRTVRRPAHVGRLVGAA